jgi:hypothetical protein
MRALAAHERGLRLVDLFQAQHVALGHRVRHALISLLLALRL